MSHLARSIAFLFTTILISCTNKSNENLLMYKTLDESLQSSAKLISHNTDRIYKFLEEKQFDPFTRVKAGIWYPKALLIQKLSNDIIQYIESLKTALATNIGQANKILEKPWQNIVDKVFDEEGKGKELYQKLNQYPRDVLGVDPFIFKEFNNLVITSLTYDTLNNRNFKNTPAIAVYSILSQFQNNIEITENKLAMFCHDQCGVVSDGFWRFEPITNQNSTVLGVGDEIKITAGVGGFVSISKPDIIIGGMRASINDYGVANFKTIAVHAGKHVIPVSIEYTDYTGMRKRVDKNIYFTVVNKE